MHNHLLYYDLSICLQARQLASVSVNRKWRSLDEIVIFQDRDHDFQTQRAIIYQKLHGKWNFFIRMHIKKQSFHTHSVIKLEERTLVWFVVLLFTAILNYFSALFYIPSIIHNKCKGQQKKNWFVQCY